MGNAAKLLKPVKDPLGLQTGQNRHKYSSFILNISKFKQEIDKIYSENGYSNFGFAKIPAEDLVRYKKIKDLIMPTFYDVMTDEIDPSIVAKILYDNEYKEFDWQPEEVQ